MDGACGIWNCFGALWRWLFVDKCSTATSLLSLSFAINSIFTGLSLSRFNLCAWIRRRAGKCIAGVADGRFLEKVELLAKEAPDIGQRLNEFSDKFEHYTATLMAEPARWDLMRRAITVLCASAAFVAVAFEVGTRLGFFLVCPYLLFLFGHAMWALAWFISIKISYNRLLNAMDKAEKNKSAVFEAAACISRLKASRDALSLDGKPKKARTPRKAAKT